MKIMVGGWHLLLGFCWSGQPLRRLFLAPSACFCNEKTDEGYHFMLDLRFGAVVIDHIEPYWWKNATGQ